MAKSYVVKAGDTLSKIAKEMLGDAGRWPEIIEANKEKITDPNLIQPGLELKIPTKTVKKQASTDHDFE